MSRSSFPASSMIFAVVSRGMALSLVPPASSAIANGVFSESRKKKRPIRRLEFARSLSISPPECPPSRPEIWISNSSPLFFSKASGSLHTVVHPPAQLASICPSSSESRFNTFFPFNMERSMPFAPSMPTSSDTVITTSSLGCSIVSESRIASAYATAIPSSPPSVVPFAVI